MEAIKQDILSYLTSHVYFNQPSSAFKFKYLIPQPISVRGYSVILISSPRLKAIGLAKKVISVLCSAAVTFSLQYWADKLLLSVITDLLPHAHS